MLDLEELGTQAVATPPVRTPSRRDLEQRVERRRVRRQQKLLASCLVLLAGGFGLVTAVAERTASQHTVVADGPVDSTNDTGLVYVPSEDGGRSPEGVGDELGRVMFGWTAVETTTANQDGSNAEIRIRNTDTGNEVSAVVELSEPGRWAVVQIGTSLRLEQEAGGALFTRLDVPIATNGLGPDGVEFFTQSSSSGNASSIAVHTDEDGPVLRIDGPSKDDITSVLVLYRDASGDFIGAQGFSWSVQAEPFVPETVPDSVGLPLNAAIDLIEGSGILTEVRIQDSLAIEQRRAELRQDGETNSRTIEARLFEDLTDEGVVSMESTVTMQMPPGGEQLFGRGDGSFSGGRVVLIVEAWS